MTRSIPTLACRATSGLKMRITETPVRSWVSQREPIAPNRARSDVADAPNIFFWQSGRVHLGKGLRVSVALS
jgi:hypothetical protein